MEDGTVVPRTSGTPQGGVISPVLANLFLHYVFDDFMAKEFLSIPWARYADDGIAHCVSLKQAKYLQRRLQERFVRFGLELNMEKTRIVYCKDDDRKGKHEHTSLTSWDIHSDQGMQRTNMVSSLPTSAGNE